LFVKITKSLEGERGSPSFIEKGIGFSFVRRGGREKDKIEALAGEKNMFLGGENRAGSRGGETFPKKGVQKKKRKGASIEEREKNIILAGKLPAAKVRDWGKEKGERPFRPKRRDRSGGRGGGGALSKLGCSSPERGGRGNPYRKKKREKKPNQSTWVAPANLHGEGHSQQAKG